MACEEENQWHSSLRVITYLTQPILQSGIVLFYPGAFIYPIKGTNFTAFSLLLILLLRSGDIP